MDTGADAHSRFNGFRTLSKPRTPLPVRLALPHRAQTWCKRNDCEISGLGHFQQSGSAGWRAERRRSFCPWASFWLSYRVQSTCAFALLNKFPASAMFVLARAHPRATTSPGVGHRAPSPRSAPVLGRSNFLTTDGSRKTRKRQPGRHPLACASPCIHPVRLLHFFEASPEWAG